jgi:NADH-quinone oxidoreductase subunit J
LDTALFFFWAFGLLAVLGAVGVVVMRQPIHSALCLLVTLLAVAGLFILNSAEFLFAVQILVYTGGIMVLFLFTIMLVNVRRTANEPFVHKQTGAALLVGAVLFFVVGGLVIAQARKEERLDQGAPADVAKLSTTTIHRTRTTVVDGKKVRQPVKVEVKGNSQAVAWGLYRDYLVPFEVASIFLLVAMIGAVVLGKRSMERID